ncbi:MAG: hypothetical protein ABI333_06550 [bacterium]
MSLEPPTASAPAAATDALTELNMGAVAARHIERVLALCDGKVHGAGGAAEKLGLNASTLRARMNKLGIKPRRPGA